MTAAWSGSVGQLIELARAGTLVREITSGYQNKFQKIPGESEISSWEHAGEILLNVLTDVRWHGLRVFFEYAMPSGEQRADIIFVGGDGIKPKGLVLELKRWPKFLRLVESRNNSARRIVLSESKNKKTMLHPLLQAQKYAHQILYGSLIGSRLSWLYTAVLPNMEIKELSRMLSTKALPGDAANRMLGKENYVAGLHKLLDELLPAVISEQFSGELEASPYHPSHDLVGVFSKHAHALRNKMGTVFDIAEIDLTEAQEKLCKAVIGALTRGERKLFMVKGGPGSGKTYVAILLLLRSLNIEKNAQLAVYNGRLHAVLDDCLEEVNDGASVLVTSVSAIRYQLRNSSLDLLVCDEAQRLSEKDIQALLSKAGVVVMFYDDQQRLNPAERGAKDTFERFAKQSMHVPIDIRLEQAMRCKGGNIYHAWVEKVISGQIDQQDRIAKQEWLNLYNFEVVNSCDEMIKKLRQRSEQNKVVITASWTESSGNWNNSKALNNIRYKDEHHTLYWWMNDYDYILPWTYGRAENLDRACSIYGTQGFESDYVGVIWGKDYIYNGREFVLGDPRNCYDPKLAPNHVWDKEALLLLKNRYRIFLTRGRLGTIVFCEDEETRDYLVKS